jgi:general secretion pathway protein I
VKVRSSGFTLIEVLIAMTIMAGGIIVIAQAWSGNFLRIRKSAIYYDAATLLERKMVETEAKYRIKNLTEIPDEESGDFGKDYPQYRWELKSRDLKLPDLSSLLIGKSDEGADEMMLTMIKQVTEYLSTAIKEVKISVFIKRGKKELAFDATQYFVDYNKEFAGGLGGLGGGGNPAAPTGQAMPSAAPNTLTGGHQ